MNGSLHPRAPSRRRSHILYPHPMLPARRALAWFALIFGAWTAFGLLNAAQYQLMLSLRGETRPVWMVLGPSLVGSWIWACYTPGLVILSRRLRHVRERQRSRLRGWTRFVALHLVILGVGAVLDALVWAWVRPLIDGIALPFGRVFASTLMVNVGSYLVVVTLAEAADYAARWRERERAAAALARTAETLRHQLDEARLRALEAQLRPHFLYNTLNLVAELVHEEPQAADEMLTHLGALLRRSYRENSHLVRLEAEIGFVRAYAEILARRYRDRATLTISIPAEVAGCLVPAFLLQPLVENAFRHGVERYESASLVEIVARRDGDLLQIRVRDRMSGSPLHLSPFSTAPVDGPPSEDGVGLRNTRERLAVLYGARAGVSLVRTDLETVVSVWLPFHVEWAVGRPPGVSTMPDAVGV
jgi:two-component system LytT family sensor kinase